MHSHLYEINCIYVITSIHSSQHVPTPSFPRSPNHYLISGTLSKESSGGTSLILRLCNARYMGEFDFTGSLGAAMMMTSLVVGTGGVGVDQRFIPMKLRKKYTEVTSSAPIKLLALKGVSVSTVHYTIH